MIAKHDKTHTHLTRRQDVPDAFNRHAPSTRRDRKTRQDAYALNKMPGPARRFQQARSLDKTRSQNTTRRIHTRQDAKTCKTLSTGTLPHKTRSQNRTRRIHTRQDAKTCKTLSTGTLPHKTRSQNTTRRLRTQQDDKTHTHLTRCQDVQDAFNRHAPSTRRDRKTRQDAYALNKTPGPARRFQQARSLDKTRSQNTTRRIHIRQDAKTCKTLSTGTLPSQDTIAKHNKTHTHSTSGLYLRHLKHLLYANRCS